MFRPRVAVPRTALLLLISFLLLPPLADAREFRAEEARVTAPRVIAAIWNALPGVRDLVKAVWGAAGSSLDPFGEPKPQEGSSPDPQGSSSP